MSETDPKPGEAPPTDERVVLDILELGAQGDGVALWRGRRIFIPFALPGERVAVEIAGDRGRIIEILSASGLRAEPSCPQFGVCGGCSLQHLSREAYLEFKRSLAMRALASVGLEAEVEPVRATEPRTRRRATFAAARQDGGVRFGFHGRKSWRIELIEGCTVITPGLAALIPVLEAMARICAPRKGGLSLTVTETLTGFDISLTGLGRSLPADERAGLIARAGDPRVARLSIEGEVVLERSAPRIQAGEAFLTPPPGGFLQASLTSEREMTGLVAEAVAGARHVADLFAGAGTFSLPLARLARVHAVESHAGALQALETAARRTPGLKPVTTERRDLFVRPLTAAELASFDAVVMDPPRAGAEAQARRLAEAGPPRIVSVSCDAQTFARDAAILVGGGYRIERVIPIDQFLHSHHIELIACLSRPAQGRRRKGRR